MYRTHYCNDIRVEHIGQEISLAGWVDTIRDHGGVIFLDIRDYTGITQTVIHDENMLKGVNKEAVISVKGVVTKRDEETINEKLDTGLVELMVSELEILGTCRNQTEYKVAYCLISRVWCLRI